MIGIASPNPSGIPGFNEAYGVRAGSGGGSVNARPLPSWNNVVTTVLAANDSVSLPPAAPSMAVLVMNKPDPALGTTHPCTVFGNLNQFGVVDTIANATGVQGNTGVSVAANAVAMFWVLTPQTGPSNAPLAGTWQYKVLA